MDGMTADELATLIGCPPVTVKSWRHKGWIAPTKPAPKPGQPALYDMTTALAVLTMGLVRLRGLDFRSANAVYRELLRRNMAEVEADIAAGNTHLICVGSRTLPLCRREDVSGNKLAFELAEKLGVPFVLVDLGAAVERLKAAMAQIRHKPKRRIDIVTNDAAIQLDANPVDTQNIATVPT